MQIKAANSLFLANDLDPDDQMVTGNSNVNQAIDAPGLRP